jgi:NAD(P)-dependent dehydrogenase (short-subunit alcohol dehydrogenase family)
MKMGGSMSAERVAVVTGGTRGIGWAITESLASEGIHVAAGFSTDQGAADAVLEGVIDRPKLIFAPVFGAGAVAGYSVLRVDPSIVVSGATEHDEHNFYGQGRVTSSEDVYAAFGT